MCVLLYMMKNTQRKSKLSLVISLLFLRLYNNLYNNIILIVRMYTCHISLSRNYTQYKNKASGERF